MSAYLTKDRLEGWVRRVRELVTTFAGLSGSAKPTQVLQQAGLVRATLEDLVVNQTLDMEAIAALLHAMQEASKILKPEDLGVLKREALLTHLQRVGMDTDSLKYKRIAGVTDGLPYVIEAACGFAADNDTRRVIRVGLNWAPTLPGRVPFPDITSALDDAQVERYDPVEVVLHLACPRFAFTDRGKTTIELPDAMADAVSQALASVTKDWTALKRHMDRMARAEAKDIDRHLKMHRQARLSLKEATYQVMEEVFAIVSDNGRLPAGARQMMYQARPRVMALTDGVIWKNDAYFTQTMLNAFLADNPTLTADWDIVFDARGHIEEPHTGPE